MKILSVTTLYPHAAAPSHGVFVENRLAAFVDRSGAQVRVVAPVPWFPVGGEAFGAWGRHARAPLAETRRGFAVVHPRYAIPPKIGMNYAPRALARVIERAARAAIDDGFDFDLIDAHYLYPDGVAAAMVARRLGKPFALTARGSDVTLLPNYAGPRRRILDALRRADAVIAVSASLKAGLEALGAPTGKVVVLRNGVDLALFSPRPMARARAALGLAPDAKIALSVGHLIARKGHDVAIRAIARIDGAVLLIVGEGPDRARLEALARAQGVADRVRFLGRIDHEQLPQIYSAADALVLASAREGWPNVLLEAMACGARVVASNAGGIAEVVAAPEVGEVVAERTPEAFAAALTRAFAHTDRGAARRYAELFSWNETSDGLGDLFAGIIARRDAAKVVRPARFVVAGTERPRLLMTVDTEEAFDWAHYGQGQGRVCDPADLEPFVALCAAHGGRPLFFLTWPLLADARACFWFERLVRDGRADAGVHLHAWETPPFDRATGERQSFQTNLPPALYRAKLQSLAQRYRAVFGVPPRAHRAGRYGVGPGDYALLAEAGLAYDFSPSPGFDFSARGGPDFSAMSNHPFTVETGAGRVIVTPVSGALALRRTRLFFAQPAEPSFDAARVRRRDGALFAPLRLTCENARFEELVALSRRLRRDGAKVMTFSLHSTTLTAGGNPYSPDANAVAAAQALMARYCAWFTGPFGGEMASLGDLERLYGGAIMLNSQLRAAF